MLMRPYLLALVAALFLVPLLLIIGGFQATPLLPPNDTVSPYQAAQSQDFLRHAKAVIDGSDPSGVIRASEDDFNALIASAARVIRPLKGQVSIDETGLAVQVSAKAPGLARLGWINLDAKLGPSQENLALTRLKIGHIPLPPAIALWTLKTGLDLATPDNFGTQLLDSVLYFEPGEGVAKLGLDAGGPGDQSLYARAFAQFESSAPSPILIAAKAHYDAMSAAVRADELNRKGSITPWLVFALRRVDAAQHSDLQLARADLHASFLALAAHCGGVGGIEKIVGDLRDAEAADYCLKTRLHRRRDLRKHFVVSAALQGLGGSTASFGLGEVKELVDSGNIRGSGFSFDDIAADRAGIRFAEKFTAATPPEYASLIAQLTGEPAYMPSVKDLPRGLSAEDFIAQFESVDSPAYHSELDSIDQRINDLPLHQSTGSAS